MSNIKKKLRAIGAKVRKSTPAAPIDPTAALNANMAMFINAQGAFLTGEVTKAREEGLKLGLGIDAAESLRLLAVENAEQRALLTRLDSHSHSETEIDMDMVDVRAFLAKPQQRFVLKAENPLRKAAQAAHDAMEDAFHCQPSCGAKECDAEHEAWHGLKAALGLHVTDASTPPGSTDSPPAAAPPAPESAPLVQALPAEPQAGEAQVVQPPT